MGGLDEDLTALMSSNSMKSITEPQLRLAPIRVCACDFRASPADEAHQFRWRRLFLTASSQIIVSEHAKGWVFKSIDVSIELGNHHNRALLLLLPKIMEIGEHKDRMEALGGRASFAQVAHDYHTNLRVGSGCDDMDISESAVDAALTVRSRALSNLNVYTMAMMDFESHATNPLGHNNAVPSGGRQNYQ